MSKTIKFLISAVVAVAVLSISVVIYKLLTSDVYDNAFYEAAIAADATSPPALSTTTEAVRAETTPPAKEPAATGEPMQAPTPTLAPTQTPAPPPTPTPVPTPEATPTPTPRPVNPRFNEPLERNPDIIGWIYIENTKIDYPVLYDGTHRYLEYDVDGNKTTAAAIYMDPTNRLGKDSHNILLHGHNMKNGTMFHDVVNYKNEKFFRDPAHGVIFFDTLYDEMVWEVFSVYVLDADHELIYTNFRTYEDFIDMAESFRQRSMYSIGEFEFTGNDRILTLSTCSYETPNARTELHARLIYKNGIMVAEPLSGYTP